MWPVRFNHFSVQIHILILLGRRVVQSAFSPFKRWPFAFEGLSDPAVFHMLRELKMLSTLPGGSLRDIFRNYFCDVGVPESIGCFEAELLSL